MFHKGMQHEKTGVKMMHLISNRQRGRERKSEKNYRSFRSYLFHIDKRRGNIFLPIRFHYLNINECMREKKERKIHHSY